MDISKYIHEFDYIDENGYVHFKGLKRLLYLAQPAHRLM